MKPRVAIAVALALGACDRIPGTDAYKIKQMERQLAGVMFDPEAVRFRETHLRRAWRNGSAQPVRVLCGEVNGKNRNGGYIGFRRFIVGEGGEDYSQDPQIETTKAEHDAANERCLDPEKRSSNSYQLVEDCNEAISVTDKYYDQMAFEDLWLAVCVKPIADKSPFETSGPEAATQAADDGS